MAWNNIYVEIKGNELSDEIFVLGAHFDAVPGSPGADDNGSGVAALLAIAAGLEKAVVTHVRLEHEERRTIVRYVLLIVTVGIFYLYIHTFVIRYLRHYFKQ